MKKYVISGSIFLFLFIFFAAPDTHAEIYKYIDKDGIPCFADDIQQVPEKYRAFVTIIDESSEEYKAKAAVKPEGQNEDPVVQEPAQPPVRGRRPLSFRLMISAAISAGLLLLMNFLGKLPELKHDGRLRAITRNSLIATVSLYLIFAHGKDVLTVFGIMGNAVEEVQQHSSEKGKKAAQAIKSLDAMFEAAQVEKEKNTEKEGADQARH